MRNNPFAFGDIFKKAAKFLIILPLISPRDQLELIQYRNDLTVLISALNFTIKTATSILMA